NVLCLSSTTVPGSRKAVDRFVELLGRTQGNAVGPLIDVHADEETPVPDEAGVVAARAKIEGETSSRSMGGVVARYANLYYRTGVPQWAALFLASMRQLDKLHEAEGDASDVRTCRYLFAEFDRIDEGPTFSAPERLELVNLFFRFAQRMTYAKRTAKPSAIPHGNNWNAIGASYAGLYFSRYYPDNPIGKRILDTLDVHYEPNMTGWKVNEDCPGYGNITLTGNYDWALARPDWRYFDLECLRRMADFDMLITDNAGRCSGYGDSSGLGGPYTVNAYSLAAWLYKDGRYLWWWDRHIGRPNRYWVPETILPRKPPDDLLGVAVAPLADWIYNSRAPGKTKAIPRDACFDKVSFRSGFEPDDQYLCISGFSHGFHSHPDANAIIRYQDRGAVRLYDDGYMIPALSEHNTIAILKDGWAGKTPDFSQIAARADFPSVGLFESRLENYNGIAWDRAVIWLKKGWFFIVDDLQCKEEAEYAFQCIWRALGQAKLNGNRWVVNKGDTRFTLVSAGAAPLAQRQSAGTSLNAKPFPLSKARALVQAANQTMKPGDSCLFANLISTDGLSGAAEMDAAQLPNEPGAYVIQQADVFALAGVGKCASLSRLELSADVFCVTEDGLFAAGLRALDLDDLSMRAAPPVDVRIDWKSERGVFSAAEGSQIACIKGNRDETLTIAPGAAQTIPGLASADTWDAIHGALKAAHAAARGHAGDGQQDGPKGGTGLTPLWQYTDFRAYCNLAEVPDATCRADVSPLDVGYVGHGTGDAGDLLRPGANIMFPKGKTVRIEVQLPKPMPIVQVTVKSRQLKTFRDGCGVRSIRLWISDERPEGAGTSIADLAITAPLPNALLPCPIPVRPHIVGRSVTIEFIPYTPEHKVYLDSISIDGIAPKAKIAESGFQLNALQAADVDGDGRDDLFTAGTDRALHAIAPDGSSLWRYDTNAVVNQMSIIPSEQPTQIVAACEDHTLYAVTSTGSRTFAVKPPPRTYARPGYRGVRPFQGRLTVVTNGDLDGNGIPEIIVGAANWRTYAYDLKGTLLWDDVCWAHTPTCGTTFDLDGDGTREVIMGNSYTRAVVYSSTGKIIGKAGGSSHAGPTAVVCADLDGNGKGEIVVGDRAGKIWFQEWHGRRLPTHNTGSEITDIAIGDLDGDGALETIVSSSNYLVYIFDANGKPFRNINPLTMVHDIALADVTDDGHPELLLACADGTMRVVRADGTSVGQFRAQGAMRHVTDCELDGDRTTREIAVASDDGTVYALRVD
ncbi:MAG: VCBS repeat-containing protein, partial [Lentisphaerae bacterium]|nr:VCBS repeat-containing protein [Lentisphaerota bacterium]